MMLTTNCSLSYRHHLSMTAVGKLHFSRKKSHFDSATMHDVIGNHGGKLTHEQNSVPKNFGGRTRSQINHFGKRVSDVSV